MTVDFSPFYQAALDRFGSSEALAEHLPIVRTIAELELISDDRYLSAICLRMFRAGMKHSMVDDKWPAFDEAFEGFHPHKIRGLTDEELEQRMNRDGLIKNWDKIKAIRTNAEYVASRSEEHHSFGHFVATWPEEDVVGLWADVAKHGAYMGGKSAASFLRYIGKDTFMLTDDVVRVFTEQGIVSGNPETKANLAIIQKQFNDWQHETNLPISHLSRILSFTVNQQLEI